MQKRPPSVIWPSPSQPMCIIHQAHKVFVAQANSHQEDAALPRQGDSRVRKTVATANIVAGLVWNCERLVCLVDPGRFHHLQLLSYPITGGENGGSGLIGSPYSLGKFEKGKNGISLSTPMAIYPCGDQLELVLLAQNGEIRRYRQ